MEIKELALAVAKAMDDKLADNVQVLDMRGLTADTDFFVVGSCPTLTQVNAITEAVHEKLDELQVDLKKQEGRNNNSWVLLDCGDFVVHIFLNEEREYYSLEKLWADAKQVPFG